MYCLRDREKVPDGLKRIVREQLQSAIASLRGPVKDRTEEVHEARKNLKKVRAILRLMEQELGPAYRIETMQLRLRGRQLSDLRDAAAGVETIDLLRSRVNPPKHDPAFAEIRKVLADRKQQFEEGPATVRIFHMMAVALRSVMRRAKDWPLRTEGFAALAPGIKETFRRGRKALQLGRQVPNPENLHALRRRAKELWYQLRLISGISNDVADRYEKEIKKLQDHLGEYQNLEILRRDLAAEPERFGKGSEVDRYLRAAEEFQKELCEKAFSIAHAIYRESPGRFLREIEQSWHKASLVKAHARPARPHAKS